MSTATPAIDRLRSIEFDVLDLSASLAFYEECWGLACVARDGGAAYLRATGPEHHIVVLRAAPQPRARRVNFGVADRSTLEALHAALGNAATSAPAELAEPGGGYGFAFRDPEGREYRAIAGQERHAPLDRTDAPMKISHVVFESADAAAATAFFCAAPGFRLRDHAGRNWFLGCNPDHHSFGFGEGSRPVVSHVAFELPSIDGLMRAVGRMKRAGATLEWGVGRHGPGNNVFAYFFDPNGFTIEYTAEMQQVDDSYPVGTPEVWDRRTSHDLWGVAGPPSERFRSRRRPAAAATA